MGTSLPWVWGIAWRGPSLSEPSGWRPLSPACEPQANATAGSNATAVANAIWRMAKRHDDMDINGLLHSVEAQPYAAPVRRSELSGGRRSSCRHGPHRLRRNSYAANSALVMIEE